MKNQDVVDYRHELNVREPSQRYRRRERGIVAVISENRRIGNPKIRNNHAIEGCGNRHNHQVSNHGWYLSILTLLHSKPTKEERNERRLEIAVSVLLSCYGSPQNNAAKLNGLAQKRPIPRSFITTKL